MAAPENRGREAGEIGGITQQCVLFCSRNRVNGKKPRNKRREESGMQGTGGGDFGSPVPSPFMVQWKRRGMEILNAGHPDTFNPRGSVLITCIVNNFLKKIERFKKVACRMSF